MKKILSCLLALFLFLGSAACAETASVPEKDLLILYTSDVHCGIEDNWGYAGVCAVKQALSESYDVLLVDDGDHYQGAASGTLSDGEAILDIMNSVGYDVVIPGNHDFDYGVDNLLNLVSKANYEYVCCNFFREGKQVFPSWTVREVGTHKVGFVGVTTPQTLISCYPKFFQNEQGEYICDFLADASGEKLCAAIQKAVDEVTAEGVDYVILLAHLGNDDECRPFTYADVIAKTTGITAVLDGHSHDTDQVVMKNKNGEDVVRSACGTKLANIGSLTITRDGKVSSALYPWHVTGFSAQTLMGLQNAARTMIDKVMEEMNKITSRVVGKTPVDLTITDPTARKDDGSLVRIIRQAETNLADLVTDAYLAHSGGADCVMINGGGIRETIKAGDITLGDLLAVQPFNNSLALVQVTGQQLLDALEWGVHVLPGEFGGFPHVAGMTYEVDSSIPTPCLEDDTGAMTQIIQGKERRIRNVLIGGKPLEPEKTYKLCGVNFTLLSGGDGYSMFKDAKVLMKDIVLDNQALIEYLQSLDENTIAEKYSNPYGEGRIVSVNPAK